MSKLFFVGFFLIASCSQQTKKIDNTQIENRDTSIIRDTDLVTAPQPAEKTFNIPSSQSIIPGKKIGMITIGEKVAAVHDQLGTPDFGDAAMQKSISGWYSKTDSAIQTKIYFENDMSVANTGPHVVQIRVNSTFFKTENGITTGSTLHDIKQYHPNIKSTLSFTSEKGGEKIKVMDDNMLGIAFEIDAHDICKGITVHVPDHDLFGYLQFYQ